MERLIIVVLKLLLQLSWIVFKFVLRLVLFAWSGDWHKLDKIEAQIREAIEQVRSGQPAQKPKAQQKSARARPKSVRAPRPAQQGPWPFEFAPELTEEEPQTELQGGEALVLPRALPKQRRPPPRKEPPLALALRDPRTVRDAMVLTAVLGPRDRRARRFG